MVLVPVPVQKDTKAILTVHEDVGENVKIMTIVQQSWLALDLNVSIPVLELVERWLNVMSKITFRSALVRKVTVAIHFWSAK